MQTGKVAEKASFDIDASWMWKKGQERFPIQRG
jgi:hypothetical protein